jgi:hypothetical protein
MGNYFSTLIGRHLGTENIIRPRLPGRFEPDHSMAALEPYDDNLNLTMPVVDAPQVSTQEENILTPETNSSLNNQGARLDAPTLTPGLTTGHHENDSINDVAHTDSPSNHHAIKPENKNELLHRIRSMQRFVGDSKSPVSESALNVADDSLDPAPVSTQTSNISTQPLWMSELTARLNTGINENEAKADPIVNVTIGRVEVRAVQADSPKKAKQPKKPTGIMPLKEYLKKREGKG